MRLDAMLEGLALEPVPQVHVAGLQYDSRKLRPGEAFFAFPGEQVDGHSFVPQVLQSGASAVVSERAAPKGLRDCWARVSHGRRALAHASLRYYGHPDRDLAITAVTGTNGKTTTVHLIDSLLQSVGRTTALLGTIKHRVGTRSEKAVNTTPESLDIVRLPRQPEADRRDPRHDGSLFARLGSRTDQGDGLPYCRVHELDAGSPRLSRRHGTLRSGQEAAFRRSRGAAAAVRRGQCR